MAAAPADGVPLESVLNVLRIHGVTIYDHPNCPGTTVLAKGDVLEAQILPPLIGRNMLGRFTAKFGVPPERFWQPQPALQKVTPITAKQKPAG